MGQPLTCQFETESGESVLAAGQVTWCQDGPDGGEFGLSFGQLDAQSLATLSRLLPAGDATDPGAAAPRVPVGRVRLHIDGLGAPMRARVRDASSAKVTTTSDLGYLTAGKLLELEDAETGDKRPARIQRVEVETNEAHVPQLVVTMKYQDAATASEAQRARRGAPAPNGRGRRRERRRLERHEARVRRAREGRGEHGGRRPEEARARHRRRAAPREDRRGHAGAEAQGRRERRGARAPHHGARAGRCAPLRRPQGRPRERERDDEPEAPPAPKLDKRKLGIAGAVGVALILGLVAMRKPHEPAPLAAAPAEPVASAAAVAPLRSPRPSARRGPRGPRGPPIVAAAAQPSVGEASPALGAEDEETTPERRASPSPSRTAPSRTGRCSSSRWTAPSSACRGPAAHGLHGRPSAPPILEAASPLAARTRASRGSASPTTAAAPS
ncbi:MAG: PilZ domain-containing protein [Myxococcales bacterium]|nr:PilZ domain-containing protein [Myxococcales bacterium]